MSSSQMVPCVVFSVAPSQESEPLYLALHIASKCEEHGISITPFQTEVLHTIMESTYMTYSYSPQHVSGTD